MSAHEFVDLNDAPNDHQPSVSLSPSSLMPITIAAPAFQSLSASKLSLIRHMGRFLRRIVRLHLPHRLLDYLHLAQGLSSHRRPVAATGRPDRPIKHVVVLEALPDKEISEELAQVRIIGLVVETEGAGVIEVDSEFVGERAGEDLGGSRHF